MENSRTSHSAVETFHISHLLLSFLILLTITDRSGLFNYTVSKKLAFDREETTGENVGFGDICLQAYLYSSQNAPKWPSMRPLMMMVNWL